MMMSAFAATAGPRALAAMCLTAACLQAAPVFAQAAPAETPPTVNLPGDANRPAAPGDKRPAYEFETSVTPSNLDRPTNVNFRLGGYFSMVYRESVGDTHTASFDQHRFVPQVEFTIADRFNFKSEVEIEGGGADADFLTENEILVEYAELTCNCADWFKPKAGLLLIPFGRYNLVHDDPLHNLFDRPFVARRVVPSAFDQPGVGAEGTWLTDHCGFNYNVALVQGFDDGFSSNGGSRGARQSFREDNNDNKAFFGRAALRPNWERMFGLEFLTTEIGGSFTHQTIDPADRELLVGLGADLSGSIHVNERISLDYEGEYARFTIDRVSPAALNALDGYYTQAGIRWRPWDDGAWDGWLRSSGYLALTGRWEQNDLNDDVRGAATRDDRSAVTVGLAFRPWFKTVLRAEWKFAQSRGDVPDEPDRFVISLSTYF